MNKRSLLNHFENVLDKGYSLDSPDQKAGPAGGLHFVTQNAYLARNLWECKGGKGFGAGEDLQQAGKTGKERGCLKKWQQENIA